jgi:transcriptional regulator with XRE-family HTH domain
MTRNSPDPDKTPAGKLAKHLRLIRQAAGFPTQGPFATRLGVSNDLISKIETGKHVPTRDIFHAWLDLCGVTEEARGYLTDIWILAREAHGSIPQFIEKYFQAAEKATFLRFWALLLVPGPLQAREYAEAMYDLPGMDKDQAAERVAIRMERQSIIDGPDAPEIIAVLHEAVLSFCMGSPEVMVAQLDHLLQMSQRPNVTIQAVRGRGAYWGLSGPFQIASGPEIPDTLLMLAVEDQTNEDPTLARKALTLFEKVRGYALNVEDSQAVIMEARTHWQSQQ